MPQQIILKNLQRPKEVNIEEDIEWLGNSLGFSAGRDTKRVTTRILQSVLKEAASQGSTSTENLADELDFSVQRVNYHLRSLIDSGFLFREKRLVFVRQGSVKAAIEEIRHDANRIFNNLSLIAEEIDSILGFKNR